jgi:hypothetical protein
MPLIEIRCDNITNQNSIDIILDVLELNATIAAPEQKKTEILEGYLAV